MHDVIVQTFVGLAAYRGKLRSESDDVREGWRKLHSREIRNLYA